MSVPAAPTSGSRAFVLPALGLAALATFVVVVGLQQASLLSTLPAIPLLPALLALGFLRLSIHDERRERRRLEQVVDSLRATSGSAQLEDGIRELLATARTLFSAEYAEILILPGATGDVALRSVSRGDTDGLLMEVRLADADALALDASRRRGREPIVVGRAVQDPDLVRILEARKLGTAIVGVLTAADGDLGLAVVGRASTSVADLGAADATVFAAYCGHASVVIENSRLGRSLAQLTDLKEQLYHQAFHDALTGLPNRVLFGERVSSALERLRAGEATNGPAVLLVDLDEFKGINDTWGHAAGDDVLVEVSNRLRAAVRPSDLSARLGGDEFAILLDDADIAEAREAAERLTLAFVEPMAIGDVKRVVRPSVGIAIAERGMSAERLLRNADAAMYVAKADDVRHVATYEAETHAATRRRRELALELDRALEHHEIEPHFQPLVSLGDGAIGAFEALVRWAHPVNGLMTPGEFLSVADNRQLSGIGRRVIRESCRHASLWQGRGLPDRRVGVWINLSAVDVASPTLVEDVTSSLSTFHVDPTLVTLEITEHDVIVGVDDAVERLRALREHGVRVAIDDFGTGYSSLSRLGDFPLDLLKIPQPFVERLVDDADDRKLVTMILGLARSLGLGVVAEGVEREVQAEILRELGCDLAQGYLYAPALDGDYVVRLLESGMRLPAQHGFHWAKLRQPDASRQDAA